MSYRISRNIEASLVDYINDSLDSTGSGWSNVNVEKTFARAYDITLPTICVRVGTTNHERAEIGTTSTVRTPVVLVDVFASSDGQRLDLKDWLIGIFRDGLPYYEYVISGGTVQSKTQNGRIRVLNIDDNPIDFDVPKNDLDVHDRYRHNLVLSVSLGRTES